MLNERAKIVRSAIYLSILIILQSIIHLLHSTSISITIYSLYFQKSYNFKQFVNQKIPVTTEFTQYFIEKDPIFFLKNYKKLTPNQTPTEYHEILPFHEDGTSKKLINYFDYLKDENVVIKHFSTYMNSSDKHEKSNEISHIFPNHEKPSELKALKKKLASKEFTLIYCIVVSSPNTNVVREIKAMEFKSDEKVAFIIFIDNKSNRTHIYEHFSKEMKKNEKGYAIFKNVYFVDSPRFRIGWSKITLSLSEAVLMKASIKYFPNSLYLSIHSESDYPLVPSKFIINYLKDHYPENFIALNDLDHIQDWRINRPKIFHFQSKFNNKYMKMIRFLFPKRKFPPITWQFGSNWFTATLKDSEKIIDILVNKPIFINYLEYAFVSDENLFQTVVVESKINTTRSTHRYIDWSTTDGHPRTFEVQNFEKIIQNNCNFWARKFSSKVPELLDLIDNHIIEMKRNYNSADFCK